jgi:hypothetical protein
MSPGWPLVVCGPIARRVEPSGVSVFVACSRPAALRLSVYDATAPRPDRLLADTIEPTRELGRRLHVAVVTTRPATPYPAGALLGYDLGFAPADGGHAEDLSSLGLLSGRDGLGYVDGALPAVVVPPGALERVRIAHGSCRKPHAERRDALATLDGLLAAARDDPTGRPQQLFLTGDQIYADDVEPSVLALAGRVGAAALGWDRPEALPGIADEFAVAPTRRKLVVRRRAGFTGPVTHSHLMSLAEFYGMYLLVWSDVFWPRDGTGRAGPLPIAEVLDHPAWRDPEHVRSLNRARWLARRDRDDVAEFVRGLPRVRRALANVATYMIFDDHDVTDDWNLHREWVRTVHGRPLGRRMVQNALTAYAVFQGWGNEPDRYAPGEAGGRLLAAAGRWRGDADATAEAIAAGVGLPSADPAPPVRWDYAVDTPCYQTIVLDTRTRRGFRAGGTGRAAPALLSEEAREEQLTRRLQERTAEVPVTVVVSAAPVFGHPLVEAWLQLKKLRAIEWLPGAPAAVDREAWSLHPAAYEGLLAALARFRRVLILSGDVHYGFAAAVDYRNARDGRSARFLQLTASPMRNEELRSRLLGGVPTVRQVPAFLGSRVERLVTRVTTPPSLSWLGWPASRRRWGRSRGDPLVLARTLAGLPDRLGEPAWSYTVDFGTQATVPGGAADRGRSAAEHERARLLREQNDWSVMACVVGRNNLGDVEFLPPAGGGPPAFVRQSLWFDKTSIRAGGEPERLPYTVYDLPLDPPDEPAG